MMIFVSAGRRLHFAGFPDLLISGNLKQVLKMTGKLGWRGPLEAGSFEPVLSVKAA